MYETLIRPHEVNQVPTLLPIGGVSERLMKAEHKREEKRLRQIASSRSNHSAKRKRGNNADGELMEGVEETGNKRIKAVDEDGTNPHIEMEPAQVTLELSGSVGITENLDESSSTGRIKSLSDAQLSTTKINVSKTMPEVRGHTSYLTFACLVPTPFITEATPGMEIGQA
jgi:tRNA (adenine57-N1/adenine58-N1)-methyltransferase